VNGPLIKAVIWVNQMHKDLFWKRIWTIFLASVRAKIVVTFKSEYCKLDE
jgi:hypothetical protein